MIIVTGYAGSGKTFYAQKLSKELKHIYISHDEWAKHEFNDTEFILFVKKLFNTDTINRNNIINLLHIHESYASEIYRNYFITKFASEIFDCLYCEKKYPSIRWIIEIPYLDHSIENIKKYAKYNNIPFNIVFVERNIDIRDVLKQRGWDDNRINYVKYIQKSYFDKYQYLVDEIVQQKEGS